MSSVGSTDRSYDAVGNTTAIGSGGGAKGFVFDATNRLSQTRNGNKVAMNYAYNGRGEQVRRYPTTTSTAQTYAVYDEAGRVVGSYGHAGARLQEILWLDDLPVGVIANGQLHYVEADHLGTPRVVIDPVREKAVWSWDLAGEAFGNSAPNQDPDADGTQVVFDLRFPGQRYDAASGLNQNGFRDYEAATGRYPQADPIGLYGGVSTYGYAASNLLRNVDQLGLQWRVGDAVLPGDNFNSPYCNGTTPTFTMRNFPDYGCPGLTACANTHERSHLGDAGPTICVGNSGQRYIINGDPAQRLDSERRAFQAEIACLRRKMGDRDCGDQCQRVYELRINDIQQRIIPTIDNGTYPRGARQ